MKDPYGREITGLRLSVTSRCDMRCIYCHKEGQTSGEWLVVSGQNGLRNVLALSVRERLERRSE
ncbi:MAG: hypothetical protein CVT47_02300, partial [Thermoplasmata archaeon HGW-Thermoplasmata-2]